MRSEQIQTLLFAVFFAVVGISSFLFFPDLSPSLGIGQKASVIETTRGQIVPLEVPVGSHAQVDVTLKFVDGIDRGNVQLMIADRTGYIVPGSGFTFSNVTAVSGEERAFSWQPLLDARYAPGTYRVRAYVKSFDWKTIFSAQTVATFTVVSPSSDSVDTAPTPSAEVSTSLEILSISGDFTYTTSCGTLTIGRNCSLNIIFTPQSPGVKTGTLKLKDVYTGQVRTIALRGVGLERVASPIPTPTPGSDYLASFPIEGSKFKTGVKVPVGFFLHGGNVNAVCYRIDTSSCTQISANEVSYVGPLSPGAHTIEYVTSGGSNPVTVRKTISVADTFSTNQAPDVEFVYPSSGKVDVLGNRPLMVLASDPEGALRRVQIRDGDGSPITSLSSAGSPALFAKLAANRLPPSVEAVTLSAYADDADAKRTLRTVNTLRLEDPTFAIPSKLSRYKTFSVEQWNKAFIKSIPNEKYLSYDKAATGEDFAWRASFLVKAYVRMAQVTGSQFYLNKAKNIIDVMFESTDEKKVARGDLNLRWSRGVPYDTAPPQYLLSANRIAGTPARGWSRREGAAYGGHAVIPLIDGQITASIMYYVDAVLSDPRFSSHNTYAQSYIPKVTAILSDHDTAWKNDPTPTIAGSFFYTRNCDPKKLPTECVTDINAGVYSAPVAFNHNAAFYTAALLVHKHAPNAVFADRAARVVRFFKSYVRDEGGVYFWYYDPGLASPRPEDVDHGHMDVGFLALAYKMGIGGLTASDMNALAQTFRKRLYINDQSVYFQLSSTVEPQFLRSQLPATAEKTTSVARGSVGYGWIDLAVADPAILTLAESIYKKNEMNPSARSLLGWANILFLNSK